MCSSITNIFYCSLTAQLSKRVAYLLQNKFFKGLAPGGQNSNPIHSIIKRVSWFKSSLLLRIQSDSFTKY